MYGEDSELVPFPTYHLSRESMSRRGGAQKSGSKRHENNRIYAHPLPLAFVEPLPSKIVSILAFLGLSLARVEHPHCEGILDPITRSVWVSNPDQSLILWRRGFFGKGNLSRSEPSWLARQINIRKNGGKRQSFVFSNPVPGFPFVLKHRFSTRRLELTSEEITSRRRAERRQFKEDRARAIAAVAEEAESIFATEGRVILPGLSGPAIPSAATWRPAVDPSRTGVVSPDPLKDEQLEDEQLEPIPDVEHLQLTLQEAFFLSWNLDCLTILDPETVCGSFASSFMHILFALARSNDSRRNLARFSIL
jgi:tRNA-splicing endonuclease subunit Sen2